MPDPSSSAVPGRVRSASILPPLAGLLAGLMVLPALAQDPAAATSEARVFASALEAVPTVLERGEHFRVEAWRERLVLEDGTTNDVTHTVTVLANGQHWLDESGEWQVTVPEFVPVAGGFLAARGPHQVLVSDNLFVAGAITVVAPDGATWRSTPMTLAVRDRVSGEVLVLGESRSTLAQLVAPTTVLFADAFAGIAADVRVVYSASGVECDVVLRSRLPDAALTGMDPASSELVVLTELSGSQVATREAVDRAGRPDDVIRLGSLLMDLGKAFGTDAEAGAEPPRSVPVYKRVYQDEPSGRVFLEESSPLASLAPLLESLPEASVRNAREQRWMRTASLRPAAAPALNRAVLPPRRANGRFEVAALERPAIPSRLAAATPHPGIVLDWTMLNSATNFIFRGDTTYRVTNAVTLSGTNVTFEGGTVVKFDAGVGASLSVATGVNFDWQAEPFRPVTLTAKDDNSLGDTITGSSGNPSGTYASQALILNGSGRTTPLVLANLRVRHASYGVDAAYFGQNAPLTLRHAQFTGCAYPFKFQLGYTGADSYFLQNVLVTGATTLFKDCYYAKVQGSFLTLDTVGSYFVSSYSPHHCTVSLIDSILAAVGSVNVGTTNNCWVASSGAGLFETVGGGAHYLPVNHEVRTIPAGWIGSPSAAVLLAGTSTRRPEFLTNAITTPLLMDSTVHAWPVNPESETIGYHYWPIHYLCSNLVVTNTTLALTNEVTVGLAGTVGLALKSGAVFRSTGLPDHFNRVVSAALVQESATFAGFTNSSLAAFTVTTGAARPTVDARFTEFVFAPGSTARRTLVSDTGNALAALALRDSAVFNGYLYLFPPNANATQAVGLTNNVFENTSITFYRDYAANDLQATVRNNLFRRGQFYCGYFWASPGSAPYPTWTVKDNLFDNATVTSSGSGYIAGGYNGYTGATATLGGSGNKTSLVPDYITGPLGRFYYPTTGSSSSLTNLLNAGSVTNAGTVGLFHFTTTTNLVLVETNQVGAATVHGYSSREGASPLDIGFHHVANGKSMFPDGSLFSSQTVRDADNDTLPDYLEDTNGNGVKEETDWLKADTDNDELTDNQELAYGTNPADSDTDNDGLVDGVESAYGTNPLDAYSQTQQRTGHWSFDGGSFVSDEGITPTTATAALVDSYNGTAASFSSTNHQLRLPWTRTVGASTVTNFQFWNGGVRFTYVPSWYAGGANDKPTNWVRLLECGDWKLGIEPDGKFLIFQTPTASQGIRTNFMAALPRPAGAPGRIGWEITLDYRPWSSRVTINDTGSSGLGVEVDLSTAVKNGGLWVGSGTNGVSPALGFLDELEWFNATLLGGEHAFSALWNAETRRTQVLGATTVTNGLKLAWVRGWEGDWLTNSSLYSLSRRLAGSTGSWATLTNGIRTNSWTDLTATNGTYFEYRVDRHASVALTDYPTIAAVRNGTVTDDRGRAILLIDQTLVTGTNTITTELESFKRLLAADGWTVTNYFVPRHVDHPQTGNSCAYFWTNTQPANFAQVESNKALIRGEFTNHPGVTSVVLLVGHVTIPYSGTSAEDNHYDCLTGGVHAGAWPADAYYGDLAHGAGGWTTNQVTVHITPACQYCHMENSASNPSVLDQNFLPLEADGSPGRLEVPISRIDFANVPAFGQNGGGLPSGVDTPDEVERELFKRYFDKVARFRRTEIGHLDDFRTWAPESVFFGMIDSSRRLQARLWNGEVTDPGRFDDDVFLATTNYLWGFHGDYGHFNAIGKDFPEPREHTSAQVATEGERPRGLFMVTFGSFFGDWFYATNDFLRVCLGMPDTALTVSWQGGLLNSQIQWRSDRMQAGWPVYAALQDTFATQAKASARATFLLGDGTLREHYVPPVAGFSATKSGTSVNLVWTNQPAATSGYRLYTAASTNTAKWNLLTNLASGVTSWTHAPLNPSTNAYLLKSVALKTTGSGSYTNLSQGLAAPTEIIIP